jgi:ABC-type multidrug transport system fused ATPase/permease subunit
MYEGREHAQEDLMTREATSDKQIRHMMLDLSVRFTKEHTLMVLLGFATLLVIPVQDILVPHLIGNLVSSVRGRRQMIVTPLVLLMSAIVVLQVCYVLTDLLDAWLYPAMMNFVRRHMLQCAIASHYGYNQDLNNGEILAKFAKVPYTVTFWFESVKGFIPHILVFVGACVYFAFIDVVLGVAILLGVVATFASMFASIRACSDVSMERDTVYNQVQERIDETLRNLPAVYTNMTHGEEQARVMQVEEQATDLYKQTVKCAMRIKLFLLPFVIAMVAFVLYHGHKRVTQGRMSPGQLISVLLIALYMMNSMIRMAFHTKALVYHWGIIRTSSDLLVDCTPPPAPTGRRLRGVERPPPPGAGFGAVGVSYGVLRDATLAVAHGERVAIVGHIGSGKSTMLKLLARLIEPDEGFMYLNGVKYDDVPLETFRDSIAYVPQNPMLWDRSVLDNILYGNAGFAEEDVWALAEQLGLADTLREVGIHTDAGKAGSRISGGQRQVILILRATLMPGRALLLDEPSSALDPDTAALVAQAIRRSARTCVVATHNATFARAFATRVFSFSEGGDVSFQR